MQDISPQKKRFLESLDIDLENLPPEFEKYSHNLESKLSREELSFLNNSNLTGIYKKTFCLKDLVGTAHPNYRDKTWLEAFLTTKRGNDAVKKYFANPRIL